MTFHLVEQVLKVMADIEALDLIEVTMLIEAFKVCMHSSRGIGSPSDVSP